MDSGVDYLPDAQLLGPVRLLALELSVPGGSKEPIPWEKSWIKECASNSQTLVFGILEPLPKNRERLQHYQNSHLTPEIETNLC